MAKLFIEVTSKGEGKKVLVNVDKIVHICENDDGSTRIRIHEDRYFLSLCCIESFVDVFNMLVEMELV